MTNEPRGPAYRVETERLLMRCWSPEDAPRLREALDASNEHLRPHIPWMKDQPMSLADTADWIRQKRIDFDQHIAFRFPIFDPTGKTLLGETCLFTRTGAGSREIGYWLDVRQGGKGYAMEATMAMMRVGFEVDQVDRIEIHCAPVNERSFAIPEKLGFEHEATLKRRIVDSEGAYQDTMVWTLFASNYDGCPAQDLDVRAYDAAGTQIL